MGRHSIPDPDDQPDEGLGMFGVGGRPEPGSEPPSDPAQPSRHEQSESGDFGYQPTDYPHEPAADPRGFPAVADEDSPTQAFAVTGRQRTFENGEWTGTHRAVTTGRRSVSRGVIVALVTVVVVVAAVILWRFFGDALSNRTQASADRCVEGEVTVAVIADPGIAEQVSTMAESYSSTADPVGDRCVRVAVTSADADAVVNGFTGQWPGDLGERPAMWIPASSASESRLEAAVGSETIVNSRSLVTSPVLLAVRPELKPALAAQNWSTLPALQSDPAGLDALNLPGWGRAAAVAAVIGQQ